MGPQAYDFYDQISIWISKFRGQEYLHMQQQPYSNETKRCRYVFLPKENMHQLIQRMDSIISQGMCTDEPLSVRNDFEVILTLKEPKTWELKVVHEKTKTMSQIDIVDLSGFSKALKSLGE